MLLAPQVLLKRCLQESLMRACLGEQMFDKEVQRVDKKIGLVHGHQAVFDHWIVEANAFGHARERLLNANGTGIADKPILFRHPKQSSLKAWRPGQFVETL